MGQKLKIVLSDLHIGAEYVDDKGQYLTNFLSDNELAQFLSEVAEESSQEQREVELIINGDFFDFLQVPAVEVYAPGQRYPKEAYLDSSEAASVKRLDIIYQRHIKIFAALASFMQADTPKRRITVIKGTHDVHFFWPRVKNRLRELLDAAGTRSSLLLFAEEFVSREKIYVEPGHQHTAKLSCYPDFRHPLHPTDPTQIDYPIGSRMTVDFCNDVKTAYPFVNRITPITTLVWYALQWDLHFAAKLLTRFTQPTPALVFNGTGSSLAETNSDHFYLPDSWLTTSENPRLNSGQTLAMVRQQLQNEETCYQLLQRCIDDIILRQEIYPQIYHLLSQIDAGKELLGAQIHNNSDPLMLAQIEKARHRTRLYQAAEKIAGQEGAKVILFGYIHQASQETLDNGAVYINTGCWMEDFSGAPQEVWQALFDQTYQFGQPSLHLPYARIDYDNEGNPIAQLRDFASKAPPQIEGLSRRVKGWLNKLRQ